ncbi:hypothetical protein FRC07_008314 [Ceratobasidium sp. 392]|nr:hypothetical protein FRC07_008314 [Ceratobasidium sp. 392]
MFLRRKEGVVEHYIADHLAETVIWLDKKRPTTLKGLSADQERNILKEEYWTHMENFPGSRYVGSRSIQRLMDVLSSLAIDHGTSEGSTSPFSTGQIQTFLTLLSTFGKCSNEYQTYATDRFISLSDGTPSFTNGNTAWAPLMLGAASPHLARCSRTWAGRVAYVTEWRSFKTKNEREWTHVSQLGSVLVLASLLVQGGQNLHLVGIFSTLLASSAAAYGYYLNTESQNLGETASDAAVYFQKWEIPEHNVQRLALRNATPQALLTWAFAAFILLLLVSYAS